MTSPASLVMGPSPSGSQPNGPGKGGAGWLDSPWLRYGLLGLGAGAAGYGVNATRGGWDWLLGSEGKVSQHTTQSPEQQSALQQALQQYESSGGANGPLSWMQGLFSDNPEAFAAYEAPAMRQFNEQIVPGIAERFSSVGGQRSSAFPQALSQAGADLSERLSAQRANLRGQASQGIMSYINSLLGQKTFENVYQPGSSGLLGGVANAAGKAAGAAAFL